MDSDRDVTKGIGPSFSADLANHGLTGKAIWWVSDGPSSKVYFKWASSPTQEQLDEGWLYYSSTSQPDIADLDAAISDHDPEASAPTPDNEALLNFVMEETERLKSFPKQQRGEQDLDPWLGELNKLIGGGI